MRYLLLLLVLAGAVASPALGQITLTRADYQALLQSRLTTTDYAATSLVGLEPIVAATGPNQTYDFRPIAFAEEDAYSFELTSCSAALPGCADPYFQTANLVAREAYSTGDSLFVSFGQLSDDGFFILGGAARADFDPSTPGQEETFLKFEPGLQALKFPLTAGTTWTTTATFSTPELLGFTIEWDEAFTVEGWGRLLTPSGSADALRLRSVLTVTTDVGGGNFITQTTESLQFVTKGLLSASIEFDAEGTLASAGYSADSGLGSPVEPGQTPRSFALEQNYPNPFNPSTAIRYTLDHTQPVRLAVYDVLGREVAVLAEGARPAGAHSVTFEASHLPGGIYVYKLEAGAASQVRAMVLIK